MDEPRFSTATPIVGGVIEPNYVRMDAQGNLCALCPQCQAEHRLQDIPDPFLLALEKEAVEGQVAGSDVLRLIAEIRRLKNG